MATVVRGTPTSGDNGMAIFNGRVSSRERQLERSYDSTQNDQNRPKSRVHTPGSGVHTPITRSLAASPAVQGTMRRWKKLHEHHMMHKLVGMMHNKHEHDEKQKKDITAMARKIPIETLTEQWLQDSQVNIETRAYIVDKILPTLILGIEKLLTEVNKNGLSDALSIDQENLDFNPVNYLAQYLMRNNPRYCNFAEASPYVRGLRAVERELKDQLFTIEVNKLARLKTNIKQRREDREKSEQLKHNEQQRRFSLLKRHFADWDVDKQGQVAIWLVQNALKTFTEAIEILPEEIRSAVVFEHSGETPVEQKIMLCEKEFQNYIWSFVEQLSSDVFDHFLQHLSKCARAYRISIAKEQRRIALTNLFMACDKSGIGLLDRHRVLKLFEQLWDSQTSEVKTLLRNPRQWPVVELEEVEYIDDPDEKDDAEEDETNWQDEEQDTLGDLPSLRPLSVQESAEESQPPNDTTWIPPKHTDDVPSSADANPPAGRASVSFAEGTVYDRDKTHISTISLTSRSQSQASAFDEDALNVSQFVQLTETFLADDPQQEIFQQLIEYLQTFYTETEDERLRRIKKAREDLIAAHNKLLLDTLFERWDNDSSGFLDIDEVELTVLKYKDGQESDAVRKAREMMQKTPLFQEHRILRREFRQFLQFVVKESREPDALESLVDFITTCIERSYAERIRGEARKKWLHEIVNAGETGGASMEPVYIAVFQALKRDCEAHGGNKSMSAYINMLEKNAVVPERGDVLLRCVAVTPNDAVFMLGKPHFPDMKGVSFAAIENGKPIHVPRVSKHGNIHFWKPSTKPEDCDGSFIVVPLKDHRKLVYGTLGIDTVNNQQSRGIFVTHEIHFFQGVARALSIAYHYVDMRRKLLRITESAVAWIQRRCPHIYQVNVYMAEPDKNHKDFLLRRMMVTDSRGNPRMLEPPPKLERQENLFRDYLFRSVDNSETVAADAYGERHLSIPLRDDKGRAIALLDISIREVRKLALHENKEVQRIIKLLQMAHREISMEFSGKEKAVILEAENDDSTRVDIMFDRLMLLELRENVARLDHRVFAELRSYIEPPAIVHQILKAVLSLFHLERFENGEFEDWTNVKSYINSDLIKKITEYDPTSSNEQIPVETVMDSLKDVPHAGVGKQGSLAAQQLYNWIFVCLSLIEHTYKTQKNKENMMTANDTVTE